MSHYESEGYHHPHAPEGDLDLSRILDGWEYKHGEVNTRRIQSHEGQTLIQMRVAMGVLQMQEDGRPDGMRPHGFDSYLEFFEHELKKYYSAHVKVDGFHLTGDDCDELRQEAHLFYLRYLCFFRLEDYARAARDTARNLRVLDLMMHYAEEEEDRLSMQQYRPYIMMMNARARSSLAMKTANLVEAVRILEEASEGIKNFYRAMENEFEGLEADALIESSEELTVLSELINTVNEESTQSAKPMAVSEQPIPMNNPEVEEEEQTLPTSVIDGLKQELQQAVDAEEYVKAASLRDRIRAMEKVVHKHHGGVHG